ncbi:hypothetical protein M0R45_015958 [Rubus argutus]|uniref:Uncharacterized protein n=1 Tax=Rubus argutus TaxID=59490 RepID=A0AAW1XTP3_RUBAR
MAPGSNDSDDSTSADKVAESLIKAFEERNSLFVKKSLDTYAKEINGTVRELAKTVAAMSIQVQSQQATMSTVLNERNTFLDLLYKHDFTPKPEGESSGAVAGVAKADTKISPTVGFKMGRQRGQRGWSSKGKTSRVDGLRQKPSEAFVSMLDSSLGFCLSPSTLEVLPGRMRSKIVIATKGISSRSLHHKLLV